QAPEWESDYKTPATKRPAPWRCGLFQLKNLPHAAGVGAHHLLAGFAFEGFGKVFTVLQAAVHAVLAGRMGIRQGPQARAFRRIVFAPDLRKADEEALVRREAGFVLAGAVPGVGRHGLAQ